MNSKKSLNDVSYFDGKDHFWQSADKSESISLQFNFALTDSKSNIERSNYRKKVFTSQLAYAF